MENKHPLEIKTYGLSDIYVDCLGSNHSPKPLLSWKLQTIIYEAIIYDANIYSVIFLPMMRVNSQ
jgi:hypothetical protein